MIFKKIDFDLQLLILARLSQVIITLVSLRVMTSLLSKEDLGLVYYIIAIQMFYSLFLINPIGQFFNRQTLTWFENGVLGNRLISQIIYILFVGFFSVMSLLFLLFYQILNISFFSVFLISGLIFSISINQTIVPLYNMIGRRRGFVFFNFCTGFLSLILSIVLMFFFGANFMNWLLGAFISNIIIAILAFRNLHFPLVYVNLLKLNTSSFIRTMKSIIAFSLPISFATIFMWYVNSGFRIQVEMNYNVMILGVIGLGLSFANQIFSILESIITQYFIPNIYKSSDISEDQLKRVYNNYLIMVIPFYVFVAMILSFSVENILPFVFGSDFENILTIIIFGFWIELCRVLTNLLGLVAQLKKQTGYFAHAYFWGAVVLFLLFLIDGNDIEVVLYKLLISNVLILVVMYFKMYALLNFAVPWKDIVLIIVSSFPVCVFFYFMRELSSLTLLNGVICLIGGMLSIFILYVFFKRKF